MSKFPPTIQNLIDELKHLPGVGPKTAERFAFYLLKNKNTAENLARAVDNAKTKMTTCAECGTFSEKSPCYICSNPKRNRATICLVAETNDLAVIENTSEYDGLYHVIGGTLNPPEKITIEKDTLAKLEQRVKKNGVKEIILALNPDLDGETTILYLTKFLKPLKVKITRLARGLPMGGNLEYADEVTLSNALKNRTEL